VFLLFVQLGFTGLPWYYMIPFLVACLGWINGFNFMDGINAITALYSLVALGTFLYLDIIFNFISVDLITVLIIALAIFTFFNARTHARAFAGDVGSVSMAYLLTFFMVVLIWHTKRFEYALFFAVYAVDIVFTISYRLTRGENIFIAHRSHLYQWLSNELGWHHVLVSALFALVQLAVNILTIALINKGMMNWMVFLVICTVLMLLYLGVRWSIWKKIAAQS
jgi:UDP-N-acetylmuramyl pentapeptide phosphotransferase/UDP-N-acetylglucosamine-1-phosphate transferase